MKKHNAIVMSLAGTVPAFIAGLLLGRNCERVTQSMAKAAPDPSPPHSEASSTKASPIFADGVGKLMELFYALAIAAGIQNAGSTLFAKAFLFSGCIKLWMPPVLLTIGTVGLSVADWMLYQIVVPPKLTLGAWRLIVDLTYPIILFCLFNCAGSAAYTAYGWLLLGYLGLELLHLLCFAGRYETKVGPIWLLSMISFCVVFGLWLFGLIYWGGLPAGWLDSGSDRLFRAIGLQVTDAKLYLTLMVVDAFWLLMWLVVASVVINREREDETAAEQA